MPKKKSQKSRRGKKTFGEREFVRSVWKVMENQVKKNPTLKVLHERLSPEFQKVSDLSQKFLESQGLSQEKILHEILSFGEKALLPVLEFLREMKKKEP